MIRRLLALTLFCAIPAVAHAGPCDAEAAAAKRAGRDPSMVSPTDPTAIERMKEGNQRHQEALKRQRVVATQDQAGAEFQAAIDAYVAAAMISPAPAVLYNLAVTYRASGDYEKAIPQYRQFLDRAKPRRPLRRLVECHIESMTAELEHAAAKAPPHEPVSPQEPDRIETTTMVPPATPPPDASLATPAPPIDLHLDARTTPPVRWYSDGVGWGISGGGAAVAGLGAFLLLDARSLRAQINDEPRDDVRIELREKADGRQTWGTVATAAGAAILLGGIVKLALTSDAPRSTPARTSLRVSPTGLAMEGRFW